MRALLLSLAFAIASATAIHAQTLPFYNGEAVEKQCEEEAPKLGEESAKKFNRRGESMSPVWAAEQIKSLCITLGVLNEREARAELLKTWDLLDPSIRLQCIATVAHRPGEGYYQLKYCIEQVAKRMPYRPGRD